MSEAAPGFDSPLQIVSDILQMIVQRKVSFSARTLLEQRSSGGNDLWYLLTFVQMFQESKDELALILYGTEASENDLADEENYQHISVAFSLAPANWRLFEAIQKISPGNQPADCKDAIDTSDRRTTFFL